MERLLYTFHKSRSANPYVPHDIASCEPGESLAMHQLAVWRVSFGSIAPFCVAGCMSGLDPTAAMRLTRIVVARGTGPSSPSILSDAHKRTVEWMTPCDVYLRGTQACAPAPTPSPLRGPPARRRWALPCTIERGRDRRFGCAGIAPGGPRE